MQKSKRILEPVLYFGVGLFGIYILENIHLRNYYYTSIVAQVVLAFLLGVLINAVNKKVIHKPLKFDLSYLLISLICIVGIACLYCFYGSLPQFFIKNLSAVRYLLSLFAGANFVSAFTKE